VSIRYFFNSTAAVYQISSTRSTAMGEKRKDWSVRIASLPCRLSAKSVNETDEYGKVTVQNVWILYCEANSTNRAIEESDKVTLDSIDYQISGIYNAGKLNRHLEIKMTETR